MKSDARDSTREVSETDARAPNRCKKKASGGADAKQMLFLFLYKSVQNEEQSFDLCSAGASSPGR